MIATQNFSVTSLHVTGQFRGNGLVEGVDSGFIEARSRSAVQIPFDLDSGKSKKFFC